MSAVPAPVHVDAITLEGAAGVLAGASVHPQAGHAMTAITESRKPRGMQQTARRLYAAPFVAKRAMQG